MILHVFSVYDVKADLYNTPFFMPSIGQAVRAFTDLANDSSSHICKYPNDFCLRVIGTFSDGTGELISCAYKNLGFAADFKVRPGEGQLSLLKEVSDG